MIEELRKILEAYDYCNNPENPLIRELEMWRKRFIKDENSNFVKSHFMAIPSATFETKTPEQLLEEIRNYKND
jgi:ribosomal 50S subunit-associated protein YjgA (DUF615 family)